MAVKKPTLKNSRQKKVLQMVAEAHARDNDNRPEQELKHKEDEIRRQFLVIKKDYNRLMNDVAAGYGLIRNWVGLQAETRGEILKTRFIKN